MEAVGAATVAAEGVYGGGAGEWWRVRWYWRSTIMVPVHEQHSQKKANNKMGPKSAIFF